MAPENSYVIQVTAKTWSFTFTYPNGGIDNELWVVKDQPTRLLMRSEDFLHGFYIPDFRVDRNIVPGRQIETWFQATKYGDYRLYCNQYCGKGHSDMHTWVHVINQKEFDAKLIELGDPFYVREGGVLKRLSYAEVGRKLYDQLGCVACHQLTDKPTLGGGPGWANLYLYTQRLDPGGVEPGGQITGVDTKSHVPTKAEFEDWEAYLERSILDPDADIVTYFPRDVMPGNFRRRAQRSARRPECLRAYAVTWNLLSRSADMRCVSEVADADADALRVAPPLPGAAAATTARHRATLRHNLN